LNSFTLHFVSRYFQWPWQRLKCTPLHVLLSPPVALPSHDSLDTRSSLSPRKPFSPFLHCNNNSGSRGTRELTEARKTLLAIRVLSKYRIAFDPSDHYVVESSGSISSGLARHGIRLPHSQHSCKVEKFNDAPGFQLHASVSVCPPEAKRILKAMVSRFPCCHCLIP
jgi:hypothetical protein